LIGLAVSICISFLATIAAAVVLLNARAIAEVVAVAMLLAALLLTCAAPIVAFVTFGYMGAVPAIVFGIACCLPLLFIARRALGALERMGTDRVAPAIDAMSKLIGGSLAMLSLVAVIGAFMLLWERYPG
jgi:hypothetical protein